MSKQNAFAALLLFFLVLTNVHFMKSTRAGRTWTVDDNGPADFDTVQKAVDAASDGDTVFVHNGIYLGAVSVTKSISLVGESPFETIISANFSSLTTIFIHADNVTIRNVTSCNSASSHWHWDTTGGIYLYQSSGCTVENCLAIDNQNGINLVGSSLNRISNNFAESNGCGINIVGSSNSNLIKGNWMINNSYYGDSMMIGSNTYNNTIIDNCFYNDYGSLEPRPSSLIIYSPATGVAYHNNFMNKLPLLVDSGLGGFNFTWSKDGEGNFWIDYTGKDMNGDGLGDTPYTIELWPPDPVSGEPVFGTTNDSHPLMRPYKWLQGDVDCNTIVNILDVFTIARAFGSSLGDAAWNPRCDLNDDRTINILDIGLSASNFGKRMSWPSTSKETGSLMHSLV